MQSLQWLKPLHFDEANAFIDALENAAGVILVGPLTLGVVVFDHRSGAAPDQLKPFSNMRQTLFKY